MSNPQKPKIYVHSGPQGYWKICANTVGGRNIGIIDSDGYISGKKPNKLPHFPTKPGFQQSTKGASRKDGGSGYLGWAPFGSFEGALEYLKEHYEVIRK